MISGVIKDGTNPSPSKGQENEAYDRDLYLYKVSMKLNIIDDNMQWNFSSPVLVCL